MNIHFSGIGGIGMSALARYFLSQGHTITGSDSSQSPLTHELQTEGVTWIKHTDHIPKNTELHIYTEAIVEENLQRQDALKMNIPSRSYFQQLGEISKNYKTIAVCGTHGKSTVTSMTGIALAQTSIDPLVIVGTKVREFDGKNIHVPSQSSPLKALAEGEKNSQLSTFNSQLFIVEACEYRGSFLNLHPFGAILTNCEHDHIDYYKTETSYLETFKEFVQKIPKEGFLIANFDDLNVVEVSKKAQCKVIPVKLSEIQNPITPKVPGWHNQLNAELSSACGKEILNQKIVSKDEQIKELSTFNSQLSNYSGTWRRFDVLGEKDGITVIDDYAHHPSEISATLSALKEFAGERRIIIAFQPHQYSRTRELFNEFVESFVNFQLSTVNVQLLITDIYEARDTQEDKQATSSEKLVDAINLKCPLVKGDTGGFSQYSGDYQNTLNLIKNTTKKGDIFITMGAGPINQVAEEFLT